MTPWGNPIFHITTEQKIQEIFELGGHSLGKLLTGKCRTKGRREWEKITGKLHYHQQLDALDSNVIVDSAVRDGILTDCD